MTASLTTIHSSCSYLDDKLNKYNEILTFKSDKKKMFWSAIPLFPTVGEASKEPKELCNNTSNLGNLSTHKYLLLYEIC